MVIIKKESDMNIRPLFTHIVILSVGILLQGAIKATPNFSLKNKMGYRIDNYTVKQNGRVVVAGKILNNDQEVLHTIDTKKPTELIIEWWPPATGLLKQLVSTIRQGKTIFVKLEGGRILPQEGRLGNSTAGYSLKNNVKKDDIASTLINKPHINIKKPTDNPRR